MRKTTTTTSFRTMAAPGVRGHFELDSASRSGRAAGRHRVWGLAGAVFAWVWMSLAHSDSGLITADVSQVVGPVNPWVFGQNMLGYQPNSHGEFDDPDYYDRGAGVWDPERRRSVPAMVALATNIGLSVARYPGGCGAHLFDWKRTIGPLERRPKQRFGLPEFLQHCADLGATPLLTVADYQGAAADAADLVEYLNAPVDGQHPWAQRRAADGHAAPWNVRWFEYGNETEHGDHHGRKMSVQQYAVNYRAYRKAMKAVDPRIQLGAVVATGYPDLAEWARPLLREVGGEIDFAIHHAYKPGYYAGDGKPDAPTLFGTALAAGDQNQAYYDALRRVVEEFTRRSDLPLAVTEFNGHFVQEQPVPYRHCLGNALVNADLLPVLMRPQNHILMANFWQFANEYWGAVKGYPHKGEPLVKRPQYYVFELYRHHFGEQLLAARVVGERYETSGGFGVEAARGNGGEFRWLGPPRVLTNAWQLQELPGVRQTVQDGVLTVNFLGGQDLNYYHARRLLPAEPNTSYRLRGWVKTEQLTGGGGAGYQIGDARGWLATHSAALTPGVTGTGEWKAVEVDYGTLSDTREVEILARRVSGTGPVAGSAQFRDVEVRPFSPKSFPAAPCLAVNASRSKDGRRVCLMVINKHMESSLAAVVRLEHFAPRRARAWVLGGPSVDATNEREPQTVGVRGRELGDVNHEFTLEFPPHSLTAVEVEGMVR